MEYRERDGVVFAGGARIGHRTGADRYLLGSDEWSYGADGLGDRLHADVGETRWMHATRTSDLVWYVATPSGSFELRRRPDVGPWGFELVGAVAFGHLEPVAGGALVVPPEMPAAEAAFVLWAVGHIVRAAAAGAAAAGTIGTISAVNTANAVNTVTIASRF